MRVLALAARGFFAITFVAVSMHAGRAQTPAIDCTQEPNLPADETSIAISLQALSSPKIESARAEAACRAAVASDPGNPTFMFRLARALTLGDKKLEAIKYYLDAAERGHAGAMNDLGSLFEYGIGVPKNSATAIVWYERAAESGHIGAMTHLGELSEAGIAVPQDFGNARRWYQQAAGLGGAAAMNSLAELLLQDGNPSAAASWYRKAAEQGLASAMNSLAQLSESGRGVPQDYRTARDWYKKAAERGEADAMGHLGALFESGLGGPQNPEIAREWYLKGAALNGRVAMHHLGAMLENGRGASKNLSEAKLWYERAASLEYPPALNDLGRLYLAGAGVPRNYPLAESLFERAAALGDAKAMNNLAMLYLNGRGVQRDIKLARAWLEKAAALNNAEAQETLKRLDQAGLTDGTQVAARRSSCVQSCAGLHRSYVDAVCGRYSASESDDKSERTKCIEMSLTVAKQCRGTCREWAPSLLAENKCIPCVQAVIACSIRQEPPNSQGGDAQSAVYSKACLAALADCLASCSRETASTPGAPN
jgi:TPR repeat protein